MLIAFCADNSNINFIGLARKGTNNVFAKIKNQCGAEVIGVGCAAHIVNNTIQNKADLLPVDLESIVKKIYSHFYMMATINLNHDDLSSKLSVTNGKIDIMINKLSEKISIINSDP